MLCADATPTRWSSACARSRPASTSASEGGGSAPATREAAASSSTPVGTPAGSRTMRPPGGSGVDAVTPAASSAAELHHTRWPSLLHSTTGGCGTTGSRSARVGSPSGHRLASQPLPTTHRPGAAARAALWTRSTASRFVAAPSSDTPAACRPRANRCTWASQKAGRTTAPPRSTSERRRKHSRTSPSVPTAATRPSQHATACATVPFASNV